MSAFLHAAATGSLWQRSEDGLRKSVSLDDLTQSVNSDQSKVDHMFTQRKPTAVQSARSDTSSVDTDRSRSRSAASGTMRARSNSQTRPTEPWQVNRKHINTVGKSKKSVPPEVERGQGDASEESSTKEVSSQDEKTQKKPWQQQFPVNNFENRHKSQQKILQTQQKQIQDQQRLIEDLQYMQRQQLLQQEVLMKGQLTDRSKAGSAMQNHLDNMQKTLVPDTSPDSDKVDALFDQASQPVSGPHSDDQLTAPTSVRSEVSSVTNTSRAPSEVGSMVSQTSSKQSVSSGNTRHTQFLKAMENRAMERNRIKEEREKKKRKEHAERLTKLQEEEDERIQQEEEEKRKRAEMYREKKRLEKQKAMERQQEQERIQNLYADAAAHHQRAILKFHGWMPMKRLVEMARENWEKAVSHYSHTLMRKVLQDWHNTVQEELREKRAMADELNHYLIVKRCFTCWKRLGECASIAEQKARRHHEQKLKTKILTSWADWAAEEKVQSWHKERKAKEHNIWRIQRNALVSWIRYPEVIKEKEKKQQRLEEMRKRVQSILPDYDGEVTSSVKNSVDF